MDVSKLVEAFDAFDKAVERTGPAKDKNPENIMLHGSAEDAWGERETAENNLLQLVRNIGGRVEGIIWRTQAYIEGDGKDTKLRQFIIELVEAAEG